MTGEDGIDFDALGRVRDSMGDAFPRMAKVFIGATRDALNAIGSAWQQGDLETVKRETHSLKSSSAMLGGKQLSQLAIDLESAAKSGELPPSDEILLQMQRAFSALESALLAE